MHVCAIGTVIDLDLLNPATSLVGDIYSTVERIVQLTHDTVEQFRRQLVRPHRETYQQKVDFFVRRIVDEANAFLAYHASSNRGFASPDVNRSALAFCRQYVEFWRWFIDDYRDPFKAWTYSDRKTCTRWLHHVCNGTATDSREEVEKRMPPETKTWRLCMTEFGEFLEDADAWLKTRSTLNASLPLQSTGDQVLGVLARLKDNTDRLRRTNENFRLHGITKVWAAQPANSRT